MPRGAKKGEDRGQGRPKGSRNKADIERELMDEQRQARRLGRQPDVRLGKDVTHEFMKFATAQAVKHQPKDANAKWDPKEEAKFKEWAKLACAWAKDLSPYQSPTYRSIEISMRKDEDAEDDMKVIHTFDEMKIELLRQGVPPEELGRALIGPMIEHDPKEKLEVKTTSSSAIERSPQKRRVVEAVRFCEICRSKTLHVDGVCELSSMHKVGMV